MRRSRNRSFMLIARAAVAIFGTMAVLSLPAAQPARADLEASGYRISRSAKGIVVRKPAGQKILVTQAALTEIAALPDLIELDLSGTQLKDISLRSLAGSASLETVKLNYTDVSDRQLAEVAAVSSLRHLELRSTAVTDAGVAALASLKKLEFLRVESAKVNDKSIRKLEDLLPNLRVYREWKVRIVEDGYRLRFETPAFDIVFESFAVPRGFEKEYGRIVINDAGSARARGGTFKVDKPRASLSKRRRDGQCFEVSADGTQLIVGEQSFDITRRNQTYHIDAQNRVRVEDVSYIPVLQHHEEGRFLINHSTFFTPDLIRIYDTTDHEDPYDDYGPKIAHERFQFFVSRFQRTPHARQAENVANQAGIVDAMENYLTVGDRSAVNLTEISWDDQESGEHGGDFQSWCFELTERGFTVVFDAVPAAPVDPTKEFWWNSYWQRHPDKAQKPFQILEKGYPYGSVLPIRSWHGSYPTGAPISFRRRSAHGFVWVPNDYHVGDCGRWQYQGGKCTIELYPPHFGSIRLEISGRGRNVDIYCDGIEDPVQQIGHFELADFTPKKVIYIDKHGRQSREEIAASKADPRAMAVAREKVEEVLPADESPLRRQYPMDRLLPTNLDGKAEQDEMQDLIQSVVQTDSWLSNGGFGEIEFTSSKMSVTTTPAIHADVKQLLEMLVKSARSERRRPGRPVSDDFYQDVRKAETDEPGRLTVHVYPVSDLVAAEGGDDYDTIINQLFDVAPDTWGISLAEMRPFYPGRALVIAQNEAAHAEIKAVLRQLREQSSKRSGTSQ